MWRKLIVGVLLATGSTLAIAQDPDDLHKAHLKQATKLDIATIRATYEKAADAILAEYFTRKLEAEEAYAADLKQLRKAFMQAGNLAGLRMVDRMIEAFETDKTLPDHDDKRIPVDIRRAAYAYGKALYYFNTAKNEKLRTLKLKRLKALNDLIRKYTRQGDIDAAEEVEREIPRWAPRHLPEINTLDSEGQTRKKVVLQLVNEVGPDRALFAQEKWKRNMTIQPGIYQLRGRTTITGPKGNRPTIVFSAGSTFKELSLEVAKGKLLVKGCFFDRVAFQAQLNGSAEFENCYFNRCSFKKIGAWTVKNYTTKWIFTNCIFDDAFFTGWNVRDVGLKVSQCTFNRITFPSYGYRDAPEGVVKQDHVYLLDSRFNRCTLPLSVFVLTRKCVFDTCLVTTSKGDGAFNKNPMKPFGEAITVDALFLNQRTPLPTLPAKVSLNPLRTYHGAGAGLLIPWRK